MSHTNYFATQAHDYSNYRPTYPDELFRFLAEIAPGTSLVWDCGTGNGQAAISLSKYFSRVFASDISREQVSVAPCRTGIEYCVAPAEKSGLITESVDLVTVAAAVHWFDLDGFYTEVTRVLKPRGVLAVWTYFDMVIAPDIDLVITEFSREFLKPYWSPRMEYVKNLYKTLPFPFADLTAPSFSCHHDWSLERLLQFVGTFSGVKAFIERTHQDPIKLLSKQLAEVWGESTTARRITWPLSLRLGRCA